MKCTFFNENVWIPIKISLKFVPEGPIDNIPALDKIMAWRRPGDKPLSEPVMVVLPTHICVTRPQWVLTSTDNAGHWGLWWWVASYGSLVRWLAEFVQGNTKIYLYFISSLNPGLVGILHHGRRAVINTMMADALATQRANASTVIILTFVELSLNISVSASDWLTH